MNFETLQDSTPSRSDGISFEDEANFRTRACLQLKDLLGQVTSSLLNHRAPLRKETGERLSGGLVRIKSVGMVLLHRFFTYVSVRGFLQQQSEVDDVVAACCFLACKIEDVVLRASFVIDVQKEGTETPLGTDGSFTDEQREGWRIRMFKREVEILKVCAFQLNIRLPFDHLPSSSSGSPLLAALEGDISALAGMKKPLKTLLKIARTVAEDAFLTIAWYVRAVIVWRIPLGIVPRCPSFPNSA